MSRTAVILGLLVGAPQLLVGQGLPFHTQSALTTSFEQRALRAFSMLQHRGDVTASVSQLVVLPFAPHQRVTTMVVLPVVYKRMSEPGDGGATVYSNAGLGDVTVSAKWAFFVRDRFGGTTRLAVILSGNLPTGSTSASLETGGTAPRPLQLGKGAISGGATLVGTVLRGRWGINADVGHVRHASDDGFRFGPVTRYDVAIGVRIPEYVESIRTRTLQLYLEWNGSITGRSRQNGTDVTDTGGHVAYLSPGLQWVVLPQLLIEGSVQIPVIQDFNGTQTDFGIRPALGARFLFF